jgi:hypothetical protein
VVLAASLALPLRFATTSLAGAISWPSGAFVGYGGQGLSGFADWRGAPVSKATDYIGADNWSEIEDPAWTIAAWAADPAVVPDLSVPMWPATGGSLAQAAAGAYDPYFTTLAENLIAGGLGSVGIRLGWEFNGSWYRWSVTTPAQAAEYARAWQQIVTAMRSVSGAHFSFDWCPNLQPSGIDPALAYPGDTYVTEIGMDVYDWNESAPGETATQRWSDIVNLGYGLAWQAQFATAHGKPIAFPEWGLVDDLLAPDNAGGDDPLFVRNMFAWFQTHNVAFEDYFDSDAPSMGLQYGLTTGNGAFPLASAMYQALYSGQPSDTTTSAPTSTTPSPTSTGPAPTSTIPAPRLPAPSRHRPPPRPRHRRRPPQPAIPRQRRPEPRPVAPRRSFPLGASTAPVARSSTAAAAARAGASSITAAHAPGGLAPEPPTAVVAEICT